MDIVSCGICGWTGSLAAATVAPAGSVACPSCGGPLTQSISAAHPAPESVPADAGVAAGASRVTGAHALLLGGVVLAMLGCALSAALLFAGTSGRATPDVAPVLPLTTPTLPGGPDTSPTQTAVGAQPTPAATATSAASGQATPPARPTATVLPTETATPLPTATATPLPPTASPTPKLGGG